MQKLTVQKLSDLQVIEKAITFLLGRIHQIQDAFEATVSHQDVVENSINQIIDELTAPITETEKGGILENLNLLGSCVVEIEQRLDALEVTDARTAALAGDLSLEDRFNLLELQFDAVIQRISKIESVLGHAKTEEKEKPNIFDLLV